MHTYRYILPLVLLLVVAPASLAQLPGSPELFDLFANAVASGDFNGDGADDLAIGVPGESGTNNIYGALHIVYGTPGGGLTDAQNQYFADGDLCGTAGSLGDALAVGDFNGDGLDDLAAGAPGTDNDPNNTGLAGGAVYLFDGSASGLVPDCSLNNPTPSGSAGVSSYASVLAAGDFDGDGRDDLAIGYPTQTLNNADNAGSVFIHYGFPEGLSSDFNQLVQGFDAFPSAPESGDNFSSAMAAGDFNGDGFVDLAIGAPGQEIDFVSQSGEVFVIYGSSGGLDTTFTLDVQTLNQLNFPNQNEEGDGLGSALAAGDFDGDGRDDLAIGVPFEDFGSDTNAGIVWLAAGSSNGLTTEVVVGFNAVTLGLTLAPNDRVGTALASSDFDGDNRDDLAIGLPGRTVNGENTAGVVSVVYGVTGGLLSASSAQVFDQGSSENETNDFFGGGFGAGDFDDDGRADLVVGIPSESLGPGISAAGAAAVFYAESEGVSTARRQRLFQGADVNVPVDVEATAPEGIYTLSSAHPNPFAGRTTLTVEVPVAREVRVAVYDVLGREVAVLAEGIQPAGEQEVTFDAAALPSGMYVVRLTAGDQVLTQRVTVVR